jgi:integrase
VRTVGLPPVAVAALCRHKAAQAAARLKRGARWSQEHVGIVFTTATGTPIHPANLRRLVQDVATAAGIGKLAPYDLRHTAASLLSDAGVLNHELADLLGHTTTRMVEMHYRHRLSDSVDVAVAPMAAMFGTG